VFRRALESIVEERVEWPRSTPRRLRPCLEAKSLMCGSRGMEQHEATRGVVKRRAESCGEQQLVARRLGMPGERVRARETRIMDCAQCACVVTYKIGV
jgi:hypothetical protein